MVVRRLENIKFRGVAVTKLDPPMAKHSRTPKLTIFSAYFQGSSSKEINTSRKDTFSAKEKKYLETTGTSSSSEVMFSFAAHDHNYSPYTDGAGFEH